MIQTKNQYERIKYDAAVLAKGANLLRNLHMAKSKEQAAEIKFALGRIGRVEAGIFNGETGAIHDYIEDDKLIRVRWDDGDFSDYGPLALNEQIMKAYAVTIHKSQGSEYPVVIIPMSTSARIMLQRNLIYTAITRGAKHVFLVGMPAAIARACKHEEARQRYTGLRELLHTQPKGE